MYFCITGVYGLCDGPKLSRGPYLTITMFCSISSLIYVSCKAAFVFGEPVIGGGSFRTEEVALFVCSSVLAIGHIVVAYRTSCRERRKLLVFKIDIESVSFSTFLFNYINFSRYRNIMGRTLLVFKNEKGSFELLNIQILYYICRYALLLPLIKIRLGRE